ncbi:MAG: type IV pilus assembly protein PilM [Pseudobdellovibrionaceae bacterium]|nr:type IV pilus assembly protein PilM [Pseudobdellovibrionaceae bacterium]
MFFGSRNLVGIDIGSRFIKFAELSRSGNVVKINKVKIVQTPDGAYSGGDLVNLDILAEALTHYVKEFRFKSKKVAFSIQGSSVIVKKITMLKVDRKILDQQIRWEAEQYIPFDLNQVSLAYHILGVESGSDACNVLLVAAQNSVLNTLKNLAQKSGLDLAVMDVSAFALYNLIETTLGKKKISNSLLLHIGAHVTHLLIIINGVIEFVRDISIGSHLCTLEIHKELGVSVDEAETLKIGLSRGEGVPEEVHRVVDLFNQQLAEEIKNSIDYFLSTAPEGIQFGSILISGGGSFGYGLLDKIADVTQLTCQALNLNNLVQITDVNSGVKVADLSAFCPIAMGLALRKKGDEE